MELRIFENHNQTIYVMSNGELIEYKMVKMVFHITDGEVHSQLIVADKIGKNFTVDEDDYVHVYYSKEDFEDGTHASNNMVKKDTAGAIWFDNYKLAWKDCKLVYWHMVEGEPKQEIVNVDSFECVYNECGYRIHLNDALVPKDDYYEKRDECLSYSEWFDVDKDGKRTKHVGVNKLIQLDDDQKELIKKFKSLLDEMKEKGIVLIGDTAESLQAFNKRHIEDWELSWDDDLSDCDVDEADVKNYKMAARYKAPTQLCGYIPLWGEDSELYIKPKNVNE